MSAAAALAAPLAPAFSKLTSRHGHGLRWEPAFLDRLYELRQSGLSFGAAALAMGVSRNSTIGAANRARARKDTRFAVGDLPKPVVTAPNPGGGRRKVERKAPPKRPPPPRADARVQDLPLFSKAAQFEAFAPPSLRLRVWEVGPLECRFIAGDDRTMCGHAVERGTSCCAFHRPLTLARAA